jgi:uncharacterized protein with HEPN domain
MTDKMRQDALLRKLEIIGEAVKNLSGKSKQQQAYIPWREISGMRDRLTHDYFGVDLELVWATVDKDIPNLKAAIERLLAEG